MKALEAEYEMAQKRFEETQQGSPILAEGLTGNYDMLRLNKAEALEALGTARRSHRRARRLPGKQRAGCRHPVWRGDLKAETGDTSGAIEDYQAASIFMPGDESLAEKLAEAGSHEMTDPMASDTMTAAAVVRRPGRRAIDPAAAGRS